MFYYTNFIQETNTWWLRRVRPVWMGASALLIYFFFHRYYFFGKEAVRSRRKISPEDQEAMAQLNKRNFGFGSHYQPTWEKSRKKQIMDVMGEHYDFAVESENEFLMYNDFAEYDAAIAEENEY